MRLIDADELLKHAIPLSWSVQKWVDEVTIGLMSTVDAVEVVRCEKCKYLQESGHCDKLSLWIGNQEDGGCDDFFCGYGERKTE